MTGVMKRERWRYGGRGKESRRDRLRGRGVRKGTGKSRTNAGERG